MEITLKNGQRVKLLTAEKYCPEDIVVAVDVPYYAYDEATYENPEIDLLLEGKLTKIYNDRVTNIFKSSFRDYTPIEEISLPNAVRIEALAFHACSNLKKIYFPKLEYIGDQAFNACSGLGNLYFPSVKTIGTYAFGGVWRTEEMVFDNIVDFNDMTFYQCWSLKRLIIRTKDIVPTIGSRSFYQCYHILGEVHDTINPDGLQDGYIYVPDNMVEQYKSATN